MTADQIERRVKKMVDHLDWLLMAGQLTQADYDSQMRDLRIWEERQYDRIDALKRAELRRLI